MKKDFIELLKGNIGKQASEGIAVGFTKWLNGVIKTVTAEGDLQMEFEVRDDMTNHFGIMHGGVLSAILDEISGMQLFLKSDPDATFLAINLNVDFVKSAPKGTMITASPQVVRVGRKTATVNCKLHNAEGKLLAQSSCNFLRMT